MPLPFEVIEDSREYRSSNAGRAWLDTVDYDLCESRAQLEAYVNDAVRAGEPVAADWETTSLCVFPDRPERAQPVGLGLSREEGSGLYIPVGHAVDSHLNLSPQDAQWSLQTLDEQRVLSLWYNFPYDASANQLFSGWEPEHWEDVLLLVWLCNSNEKQLGLKHTIKRLYGVSMIDYDEVTQGRSFAELSPLEAVNYGCGDVDWTRRLWFHHAIQAERERQDYTYRLEKKTYAPVREGVQHGVFLDGGRLRGLDAQVSAQIEDLLAQIRDLAGEDLPISSPKALGQKLLALGVPLSEKTESGQMATGKEILQKHATRHPVCTAIVRYKELETQRRNYIQKLIAAEEHFGARVRFAFRSACATPTGRMAAGGEGKKQEAYAKGYVDLNIQSIPNKEKAEYLPNIRAAIVAEDPAARAGEWCIVSIDASQIEIRVSGNLSGEPAWIETFQDPNGDIHLTNARLAYGRPELTKENKAERSAGKTMGFAILYGAVAKTVAEHGGISESEAEELLKRFFGNAKRLKAWIDQEHERCRGRGHGKTFFGRIRPLGHYYRTGDKRLIAQGNREALNHGVQGTAADLLKIATIKVHRLLHDKGWTADFVPVLWVHDEIVAIARVSKLREIMPEVVKAMEFPVPGWPIPLKMDAEAGWNWGELQPWQAFADEVERAVLG